MRWSRLCRSAPRPRWPSKRQPSARAFDPKFANDNVTAVDGNKLTIRFDKADEKRVVDSFVKRV
jgi:hypothetical protein